MIEERILLQELVDLMDTTSVPDINVILRVAQRAEVLLGSEDTKILIEVEDNFVDEIFIQLEDIMRPRVEYNESHLKMCQDVIEHSKEVARNVFVKIDMAIR